MTPYLKNRLKSMSGEELLLLRIIWGDEIRADLDGEMDRRADARKSLARSIGSARLPRRRSRAGAGADNRRRSRASTMASP